MDIYVSLAEELMEALDRKKKGPPHEDVSAAMRGELAVLRLLEDEGRALTAGEISRLLRMTTSRIAAVLGALEKKGLIVRSADERDKRRVLVTPTERGLALGRRKKQNMIHAISYTFAQIGEQDAREFVRLMTRVYDILPPPPLTLDDEPDEQEGGNPGHER
ncbi:MAG: MarR family winged helix-turn-helix transcriptional regulator [Candidatus Ventricola sp.]